MQHMKTAGDFPVGITHSIDQLNHAHLWFMSLLLFFFVLFALTAKGKSWHESSARNEIIGDASGKSVWITFAVIGLFSAIFSLVACVIFATPANPNPGVTIGNVLQFFVIDVGGYLVYFCAGVYASRKGWFVRVQVPGGAGRWTVVCVALSLCHLVVIGMLIQGPSLGLLVIHFLVKSFLCVAFLAAFLLWAIRFWNRPSKVNELLAANSYHIYILHLLIVIGLQFLFLKWEGGHVFIKFTVISFASILVSYLVSQYFLRRYPRFSVVSICVVFVGVLIGVS
jgi:hypothetical protein